MIGIEAFLEVLARAGVQHIFGNPGTTELPLIDALGRDSRFRYVFGLHEIPIMAAADGYSMATGRVAVVNLHTACGLGNAMGMLYNASVEGTPLVVTAGQQDQRLSFDEAVLAGPLVEMAQPLVKWAAEVRRVEDLPNATRRAIQMALSPPTGPVVLSLPLDVQMAHCQGLDLSAPWIPDQRIRPAKQPLQAAAELLANATNPVILAGCRVAESGGTRELVSLAETLGAVVFWENGAGRGRIPFPTNHPLSGGPLPLWSPDIRQILEGFDLAFAVGINLFKLYIFRESASPRPESLRIIQLDSDSAEIGKNYPIEAGLIGDPKTAIAELVWEIDRRRTPEAVAAAAERVKHHTAVQHSHQKVLREKIEKLPQELPTSSLAVMAALARVLPRNVAIVEEAPTAHHNLLEKLGVIEDPTSYFAHRGWALGWGIGCALGLKLAWPDRPVLALLGDGSAMFGIQGLWTAARDQIAVVFVVFNNSRYKILQVCGEVLQLEGVGTGSSPGLQLDHPGVDFLQLARSLGVEAHRIDDPHHLAERVTAALSGNRPVLFEVPITR